MESYQLPEWGDFPALELYMDQVIALINQYLEVFEDERTGDSVVTAAMVNNYVKMKIVPPPVKKRYTRIHLAYLVMVCTLKQTLSMEMIRKIMPVNLSEEEVQLTYQAFVHNQKKTFDQLIELLNREPLIMLTDGEQGDVRDLVLQAAIFSNLSRTLTKMMLALPGKSEESVDK